MSSMNIYGLTEGYKEDIITPILQMKQMLTEIEWFSQFFQASWQKS